MKKVSSMVSPSNDVLIWIYEDGKVLYSIEIVGESFEIKNTRGERIKLDYCP